MNKHYINYVSLGYFCEVAQDLEKLGLRNFSSPFDWGISKFEEVLKAINNNFEGFMEYENLVQDITKRERYYDTNYKYWSFHDFDKYLSLEKQYKKVKEKYRRRIERFLKNIKSPTLFVHYISSEEIDENGKSKEIKWIEENYNYIFETLKKFNTENDIVFIGDEKSCSDIVKVYHVSRDEGDVVCRTPIYSNSELLAKLQSAELVGKEENKKRYLEKDKKRNSFIYKTKKKTIKIFKKVFCATYKHSKTNAA